MKFIVEMRTVFKNENSPLKAAANIVIEDCFVIHNVKLIDNGQGLFLSMPSFRGRNGKWYSTCHPINPECREEIQKAVIDAYRQA